MRRRKYKRWWGIAGVARVHKLLTDRDWNLFLCGPTDIVSFVTATANGRTIVKGWYYSDGSYEPIY